jgi:hypothetical protein
VDVHIHGNEEDRRVDVPHPQIDPIGWTTHPAEEQEQPLASARPENVRQQVSRPSAGDAAPETPSRPDRIAPARPARCGARPIRASAVRNTPRGSRSRAAPIVPPRGVGRCPLRGTLDVSSHATEAPECAHRRHAGPDGDPGVRADPRAWRESYARCRTRCRRRRVPPVPDRRNPDNGARWPPDPGAVSPTRRTRRGPRPGALDRALPRTQSSVHDPASGGARDGSAAARFSAIPRIPCTWSRRERAMPIQGSRRPARVDRVMYVSQ